VLLASGIPGVAQTKPLGSPEGPTREVESDTRDVPACPDMHDHEVAIDHKTSGRTAFSTLSAREMDQRSYSADTADEAALRLLNRLWYRFTIRLSNDLCDRNANFHS
jgi:hypothetical protein